MKKCVLYVTILFGLLLSLFMWGCGGSSSSSETPSGCNPTAGTGSISIDFTGSTGFTPAVTVQGPGGYSNKVTSSVTLTGLTTGSYTFAALNVRVDDAIVDYLYLGTTSVSEICLEKDASESVTGSYALHPASHKLWVIGDTNSNIVSFEGAGLASGGTVTPTNDIRSSIRADGGIAFDSSGRLWAVDISDPSLIAYTAADLALATPVPSVVITSPDLPSSAVYAHWSLAFDGSGNLWVGVGSSDTIAKFTPDQLIESGSQPASVVISGVNRAGALAFDAAGNLWVANRGADTVAKYTPASLTSTGTPSPVLTLTSKDPANSTLRGPSALAFDGSGNLYVMYWTPYILASLSPADQAGTGAIDLMPDVQVKLSVASLPEGMAFDEGGDLWISYGQSVSGEQTIIKLTSAQISVSGTVSPATVVSSLEAKYPLGMAFYPIPGNLPLGE